MTTERRRGGPRFKAPFLYRDGHRRDLLVVCDHASRAIPPELGDLGLSGPQRRDHIAWDPGAAGVARALARALDCPAVFGGSSRLVVDLNRHPESDHLVLAESDGHGIPGNLGLDAAERARRLRTYFAPYHDAIDHHLDGLLLHGIRPTLLSVHSFTPAMSGESARPWPAGVMWQQAQPWLPDLLQRFRDHGIDIGDNQPYDGRDTLGFTLEHHAIRRELPHVLFEIRQDQLLLAEEQARWGRLIAEALFEAGVIGPATRP